MVIVFRLFCRLRCIEALINIALKSRGFMSANGTHEEAHRPQQQSKPYVYDYEKRP